MGKFTILFIIISLYIVVINSIIFNGKCTSIANENDCVDIRFFEKFTKPKSYQVIAHMEFEKNQGVTMFYSYLKSNLIATISYDGEITFTINCFKIPFEIKHHQFMDFKLKVRGCTNIYALFKQMRNKNYDFYSHTYKEAIHTSIFKIDNYLSIWGCKPNGNASADQAAWILIDNESIDYDTDKLRLYLDDFLMKVKPKINRTELKLSSNLFNFYNITDKYFGCYNSLDEKEVYSQIKQDFPLNISFMLSLKISESAKLRFITIVLMILAHFSFLAGFFTIGYMIVVLCYKE